MTSKNLLIPKYHIERLNRESGRKAGPVSNLFILGYQYPQGSLNLSISDGKISNGLLPVQKTPTSSDSSQLKLPLTATAQAPDITPPPPPLLPPGADPGAAPHGGDHLAGQPGHQAHKEPPGPVSGAKLTEYHTCNKKLMIHSYIHSFKVFLKTDSPQVNEVVGRISNDHGNVKSKEKLMISPHYAGSNILFRKDLPEIGWKRYKYPNVERQFGVVLNKH